MSPGVMFCIELVWLGLFGWYFATDYGTRKRVLALVLFAVLGIPVAVWLFGAALQRARRAGSLAQY